MKSSTFKTIVLAVLAATATAQVHAEADFGSKKYYINPGHGGHDSNDRPTPLPLNVEIFYESDGTLSRGLFLRDFLTARNAQVKMSRTTNTSADDLALSTIASQSNSYGGYFMSLHTNAANASANYIISFFRSSSSAKTTESVTGGKAMAVSVSTWHNNNHLSNMTYATPRGIGDYSFYGYNLGVLRTNNRPGYLVETIFHDYRPDGLRLKSDFYNQYTAWQILMSTREKSGNSAGASGNVKGCIVGDIRDLSKSCGYTNYTTRGRDQYLAINDATVNLYNASGTLLKTIKTDKCCNGVYAFFDLTAGTYSVEVVKSGYATQKKSVTVANNASTKQLFDLTEGTSTGISVSPATVSFDQIYVGESANKNLTVTGTGLSAGITASCDNGAFTLATTSLEATGGKIKITYNPTSSGTHRGTITLKSGSIKQTVVVSGTAKNKPITLTEGWNMSQTSGKNPDWLPSGGWGLIRNMCFGDGKLYFVNASESIIYVVKAQTGELITKLSMDGVADGTFKVMDVKYVDGKVIACNLAAVATDPIKVYVWDNDFAAPRCILNTTERGGCPRIGDTFDIDGNLTSGRLIFAWGGSSDLDSHVVTYAVTNGTVATTSVCHKTTLDDGEKITLGSSPRAVAETDSRYWVMGQHYVPTLTQQDGTAISVLNIDALDGVQFGNAFQRFMFNGTHYCVATTYTPAASASNKNYTGGKMVLMDGSDGWNSCEQIGKYPSAGLGTTQNTSCSSSVAVNVNGTSGLEAWVLISNQGAAYYKYGTVPTYTYADPNVPVLSSDMTNQDFGKIIIGNKEKVKFNVSGLALKGDITLALSGDGASNYKLSANTVEQAATTGAVTLSYVPKTAGTHKATLTISSPEAESLTYTLTGQGVYLQEKMDKDVNEIWNHSTTANNFSKINGWWNVDGTSRAMTVAAGRVYVLNTTSGAAPIIKTMGAYSDASHSSATTVPATTVTTTKVNLPVGYIAALPQTTLGTERLYGCSQSAAGQTLYIYRWDSHTAEPTVVLTDDSHGDIDVGDIMGVWGNEKNGKIMFSNGAKIVSYTIKSGKVDATPQVITLAESLQGNRSCSEVAYNGDDTYWVFTKDNYPTRVDASGNVIEAFNKNALGDKYGTAGKFFTFGNRKYLAATTYLNNTSTTLAEGAFKIIDYTDGVDKATCLGTYPEKGLGNTRNTAFANSMITEVSTDGLRANMFVHVPHQGMAFYKFDGESSTPTGVDNIIANSSASAISVEIIGDKLTVYGIDANTVSLVSASGATVAAANGNSISVAGLQGLHIVRAIAQDGTVHTAKALIP